MANKRGGQGERGRKRREGKEEEEEGESVYVRQCCNYTIIIIIVVLIIVIIIIITNFAKNANAFTPICCCVVQDRSVGKFEEVNLKKRFIGGSVRTCILQKKLVFLNVLKDVN